MSDYLIISRPEGGLSTEDVSHGVDSVSRTLQYKGVCLYFPVKDSGGGHILLTLDEQDCTRSETDWFLRHLAAYLEADITDSRGESIFEGSEDNDLSFLDALPAPEDESLSIRIFFSVSDFDEVDIPEKIVRFFNENEYDITTEMDGFSVYLAFSAYLDIFYIAGDNHINGEIDFNCAGAGIYAEVVEIGENLAKYLGGRIEFTENLGVTYTSDKDFDKLRRDFYNPLRQQLAFAINDNREGLQAFIGWPMDAFEPKFIPDTIITPFGRYDIDTLLSEIRKYGFSYVADHRFFSRNTPRDSADFYIKEGLFIIWNSPFGGKYDNFHITDYMSMNQAADSFENALSTDKYAKFPKEIYKWLAENTMRPEMDYSRSLDYRLHFAPGYMQDEISYGFGHYLRRVKLPGGLCREEKVHGEDVFLFGDKKNGFRMECEISYGLSGNEVSSLGNNFAHGSTENIEIFDIGGSSVVRFLDGGYEYGFYRAEAEVYISDELYRFAVASESHDDILHFRDSMKGAISVEDWYDEVIREESPDPHAPGATFCANLVMPTNMAFKRNFPSIPERFIKAPFDFYKIFPKMPTHSVMDAEAIKKDAEDILKQIINELSNDDSEEKE